MESRSPEISAVVDAYLSAKLQSGSTFKERAECLDIILPTFIDAKHVGEIMLTLKDMNMTYRLWQRDYKDNNLNLLSASVPSLPDTQKPLHVIFIAPLYAIDARTNLFNADGTFAFFKHVSSDNFLKLRVSQFLEGGTDNCQIDVCYSYESRRFFHKAGSASDDGVYFKQVNKKEVLEKSATYDHRIKNCYQLFPQSIFSTSINWRDLFVELQSKQLAPAVIDTASSDTSSSPEIALLKHFCSLSPRDANEFIESGFDKDSEAYFESAKGRQDNPYAALWYTLIRMDVKQIDWDAIDAILNSLTDDVIDSPDQLASHELAYLKRILADMKCLITTKAMPVGYQPHYMNVRGADFTDADLSGEILSDLVFDTVDFDNAKLDGAVFRRSKFISCSFINATLAGTDLSEADLWRPQFRETTFNRTKCTAANFYLPDFNEASLVETDFSRAKFKTPYFSGSIFKDVSFVEAHIDTAHFTGALIFSADFSVATLIDTVVAPYEIGSVDFSDATIEWERFLLTDRDLTKCKFIANDILLSEVNLNIWLSAFESLELNVETGVKLRDLLAATIINQIATLQPEEASKVLKAAKEHTLFIKRPVSGLAVVTNFFDTLFTPTEKPACLKKLIAAWENIVLAPVVSLSSSQ